MGVTAGDIISKLQKKSRLNKDVIRKRFSSSLLASGENSGRMESANEFPSTNPLKLPEEVLDAGEQFLFEVGGNIGNRQVMMTAHAVMMICLCFFVHLRM